MALQKCGPQSLVECNDASNQLALDCCLDRSGNPADYSLAIEGTILATQRA